MNGPWSEPELTGLGRLPMHSVAHDVRLPLDGRWRFQLLSSPDEQPGPDAGIAPEARAILAGAVRELIVVEPAFAPRNPFGIAHVD